MGDRLTWASGLMAALLLGAATSARAETAPARPSSAFTAAAEPSPWTLSPSRKTLQWDSKGRWGLRLDMDKPSNRDATWTDVQAGAFFKLTPSLRIGGTVGVGAPPLPEQKILPQDPGARVHVKTEFQF